MVTEEDLKVGVIFSISNVTNFDSKYKIVEHSGEYCYFYDLTTPDYMFTTYTFSQILDFINSGTWRLEGFEKNIYELW